VEPILQPICFQIHACNGGCAPSPTCQPSNLPTCFRAIPFPFKSSRTLLHLFAPLKNSTYLFSIVSTLCVKKTLSPGMGLESQISPQLNWLSFTSSDKIASLPTLGRQLDRANEDSQ
jgi:hypothetical protein